MASLSVLELPIYIDSSNLHDCIDPQEMVYDLVLIPKSKYLMLFHSDLN